MGVGGPAVYKSSPRKKLVNCKLKSVNLSLSFYFFKMNFYGVLSLLLTCFCITFSVKVTNSSWIQWDKQLQRLYGFLKLSDYDNLTNMQENQYMLKATDSDGFSVTADIHFIFPLKRLHYFYKISTTFQSKASDEVETNQQIALWHKLTDFIGTTKIQIISFLKVTGSRILLEWFACEKEENLCPKYKIAALEKKLLTNKQPSNQFYLFMLPEYEVLGAELSIQDSCASAAITLAESTSELFKSVSPTTSIAHSIETSIINSVPSQPTHKMSSLYSLAVINLPPIILKAIPVIYVDPCELTEYKLHEDAFFDPEDGLTRSLKIEGANEKLVFNVTTQTLTFKSISKSPSFFQIAAVDKNGLTVVQTITVIKAKNESISYNISFTGFIAGSHLNDIDLRALITLRLKTWLQTYFPENSSFLLHSVSKHNNFVTIQWMPCNLRCSNIYLQKIKSLIYRKDENMQDKVINLFAPNILISQSALTVLQPCSDILKNQQTMGSYFISSFIAIEDFSLKNDQSKSNTPPVIKTRLPILVAQKCKSFEFKIPENFCYDTQDGFTPNLRLQLFLINKERPGLKHWLHLNEESQKLFGILKSSDISELRNKTLSYHLSCSDKQGETVSQQIDIFVLESQLTPPHLITFYSYLHISYSDSEVKTRLLNKIASFLGEEDTRNIEVINFSRTSLIYPHMILSWYNCTIDDYCSPEANKLRDKLFDKLNLNTQFTLAMVPEFVMIGGKFNTSGSCLPFTTSVGALAKIPTNQNLNNAPVAKQPLDDVYVPVCSTFSFRIPEDTFFDIEDGNTRELKLKLLTEDLLPISKTSWVQFVESTQVVYGFSKVVDFKAVSSKIVYFLEATDKGGKSAYTKLNLVIPFSPNISFIVNMTLSRFFDLDSSDLIEQIFLASQISSFLGDKDVSQMLVLNFVRRPPSVFLSWSNCTSLNESCPYKTKSFLQSRLFEKGQVSSTLVDKMKSYYSVKDINFDSSSNCIRPTESLKSFNTQISSEQISAYKNQPPIITRFIPPLYVDLCKPFAYHVPEDIFIDEDGNTSSLKLNLLDINFKEVKMNSWILFNSSSSTIYGMIKLSDIHTQNNDFRYLLTASDSFGLKTSMPLSFKNINFQNKLSYQLVLEVVVYQSQTITNILMQLVHKINTYFGTTDNPDILPVSFHNKTREGNNYIFTWTFCSLKFEICPQHKINEINKMLYDSLGNVQVNFRNVLKPDFSVLSLKSLYMDLCLERVTPTRLPSTEPNLSPQLIQLNPTSFYINHCKSIAFNVTKDLFMVGSEKSPKSITLRYENGSLVSPQSWIQLNQQTNVIYGVKRARTEEVLRKYILQAEYSDSHKRILPVNIDFAPVSASDLPYYIFVTFKVNLSTSANEALLLDKLKSKLVLYLKIDSIMIVDLVQNSSRFYVKFGFCTNSPKACNYNQVDYVSSLLFSSEGKYSKNKVQKCINKNLVSVLMPEFFDLSVIDELSGPCVNNAVPSNVSMKSAVCVKACGIFRFTLPKNFFFNPTISYEKQYITEVMNVNRSEISEISWMHYNESAMEFYGIPTDYVRIHQPEDGYKFLLAAFEYNGGIANKWVSFKICDGIPWHENNIEVILVCPSAIKSQFSILQSILERLSYIYFKKNTSSIHVLNHSAEQNIIKLMISGCEAKEVFLKDIRGTKINNCVVIKTSLYKRQDRPPLANAKELKIRPKFCQKNVFNIPIDTFLDDEDGNVANLYLFITFENLTQTPKNYWLTLENGEIHILFTSDAAKNVVDRYYLNARDSKYQFARIPLIIEVIDSFPIASNFLSVLFRPNIKLSTFLQTSTFFAKLNLFFSYNASYAVQSFNYFDNQSIALTFLNCSLTTADCNTQIKNVSSTIRLDNGDKKLITAFMLPEFDLEKFTEINSSLCTVSNAPVLVHKISDIIVPSKGYLIYQVPKNTFYDIEDGWTRNLSLTMSSPSLCWLEFSVKDQTIYAILSDEILKKYPNMKFSVAMTATDSSGQTTSTIINFFLEPKLSHSFSVSILFQITFMQKKSCLQEKLTIFNKLSTYLNTTLTLKSAFKAADDMFIEITVANSSMRYAPCDYLAVDHFLQLIEDSQGSVVNELSNFMIPDYIPRFISIHKEPICEDSVNTPPKVNGTFNIDVFPTYSFIEKRLADNLAFDDEDGNILNFSLLDAANGFQVKSDWIYFEENSKLFYFIGSHEVAARQPKDGYKFMFKIQDSRKAIAYLKFKITLKLASSLDKFIITEIIDPAENVTAVRSHVPFIIQWKKEREKLLNNTMDFISYKTIESSKIRKSRSAEKLTLNVTWTIYDENDVCNFKALNQIEQIYKHSFDIANYKIIKLQKCLEEPLFPPQARKDVRVYLDPCQEVNYTIEKDVFWDEKDGDTRALSVKATLVYPKDVSSDIFYNSSSQTFYGSIIFDIFVKYELVEFYLEATDSDRLKSNTTLKFFIKTSHHKFFEIEASVLYFSNERTRFLALFRKKLLTLLNFENQGLVFYNYNVTLSAEQLNFSLLFTICPKTMSCLFYERVISSLISDRGEPNEGFVNAMLEKMLPTYAASRLLNKCVSDFDSKYLEDAAVSLCQPLNYKIPLSTKGSNEWNSKELSLIFKEPSLIWLKFDPLTQTLTGRVIKRDIPISKNEYQLRFSVTDNKGNIRFKNLTLKFLKTLVDNYLEIQLLSKRAFTDSVEFRNIIQQKIDALKTINNNISLYDISTESISVPNQRFSVSIFSCNNLINQCDMVKQNGFLSTFVNIKNEIGESLANAFSDYFTVISITEKNSGDCSKKLFKKGEPLVLTLKTCSQLKVFISDILLAEQRHRNSESFELLSEDSKTLPKNSPIQLNKVNSVIYGFVTHDFVRKSTKDLRYVLRAHKSDNTFSDVNVTILLPNKEPPGIYIIKTELLSYLSMDIADIDILLKFLSRISIFLGELSGDKISIKSFSRRGDRIPQRLTVEWTNCTNIVAENCKEDQELFSKVFNDKLTVNPQFARVLNQEFGLVHRKTTWKRLSSCKKESTLSKSHDRITRGNITLFLDSRSFFERSLNKSIFTGSEDDDNLSIVMTFKNKTLIPFYHWLQFDNEKMLLFGFPDNTILPLVSYWYKITATNIRGLEIETIIEVKVGDRIQGGTQLSVESVCVDHRPPIILHIRDIVAEIAKKLKLSFTDTSLDSFHFTFNQHIYFVLNIPTFKGNLSEVQRSTTASCTILSVLQINPVAFFADKNAESASNSVPIVLNGVPDFYITCGKPKVYQIAGDSFYFDSILKEKLSFELLDENLSAERDSSFIKFKVDTLYIFYSLNDCSNLKPFRVMSIKASDPRGNFVIDSFKITKSFEILQCCNAYIKFVFRAPFSTTEDLFKTYKILQDDIYDDRADNLRIVNILSLTSISTVILLANRSLFTNQSCYASDLYNPFLIPVFKSTNPVILQSKVVNVFNNLTSASVVFCNTTDGSAIVLASETASGGKTISSEEWFLYLLPLFILGFMACISCVCFYVCQGVHRVCFNSKKPKNLLVDSGSEIIENNSEKPTSVRSSYIEIPLQLSSATPSANKIQNTQSLSSKKESVSFIQSQPTGTKNIQEKKKKPVKRVKDKKFTNNAKKSDLSPKKIIQKPQIQRSNTHKPNKNSDEDHNNQEILRLPAIPNGPPPPYSPPRRQRAFSQNVIPTYYERYAQRRTGEETQRGELMQKVSKSSSASSSSSKRPKKLLLIKKSKKYKPVLKNKSTTGRLPDTNSSSSEFSKSELTEDSFEATSILNRKYRALRKVFRSPENLRSIELKKKKAKEKKKRTRTKTNIMRYIDDVNAAKISHEKITTNTRSLYNRHPVRRRYAKPFLYDYLPVRRKNGGAIYQFHDPNNLYTGLSSSTSSNRDSYGSKMRVSRYLDTLINAVDPPNAEKTTNYKKQSVKNKSQNEKERSQKKIEETSPKKVSRNYDRRVSLNDYLENSF